MVASEWTKKVEPYYYTMNAHNTNHIFYLLTCDISETVIDCIGSAMVEFL